MAWYCSTYFVGLSLNSPFRLLTVTVTVPLFMYDILELFTPLLMHESQTKAPSLNGAFGMV